jgi:hypothetical protein
LKREKGISRSKKTCCGCSRKEIPNGYRKSITLRLDRASLGAIPRDVVRGGKEED